MRKLTMGDFEALSSALEDARKAKKDAKNKSLREVAKKEQIEKAIIGEKEKQERLKELIKELEGQIAQESSRLKQAQEKKSEDIKFVENAFYTSNEDGMGVSPNAFASQNKRAMVPRRPGTKDKSHMNSGAKNKNNTDRMNSGRSNSNTIRTSGRNSNNNGR